MPLTLGAALPCSSRAGSNMWLLSRNSIVHRDWGRTIGVCVCVCSFVVVFFVAFTFINFSDFDVGCLCRPALVY